MTKQAGDGVFLRQKLRANPELLQARLTWRQGLRDALLKALEENDSTNLEVSPEERQRRAKAAETAYWTETIHAFRKRWNYDPRDFPEALVNEEAKMQLLRSWHQPRQPLPPQVLQAKFVERELPSHDVTQLMDIFHELLQGKGPLRLPDEVAQPDLLVEDIIFTLANAKWEAAQQDHITCQKMQLRKELRRAKRAVVQEAQHADATGQWQALLERHAKLSGLKSTYENLRYCKGPYLDQERWQRLDPATGLPKPPPTKPTDVALDHAVKALDIAFRIDRWQRLYSDREWKDYKELKQATGRMRGIRTLIRELLARASLLPEPSAGHRTTPDRLRERERLRKRLK